MSNIQRRARGTTTWLTRAGSGNDLTTLSDRDLRDLGLVRQQIGINTSKFLACLGIKLDWAEGGGHERASGKVSGSMAI